MEFINYVDCICGIYTPYNRHDNRNVIVYDKKECLNCYQYIIYKKENIKDLLVEIYVLMFLSILWPLITLKNIFENIFDKYNVVYHKDSPLLPLESYIGINNARDLLYNTRNITENITRTIDSSINNIIDNCAYPYLHSNPKPNTIILVRNINIYHILSRALVLFSIIFITMSTIIYIIIGNFVFKS